MIRAGVASGRGCRCRSIGIGASGHPVIRSRDIRLRTTHPDRAQRRRGARRDQDARSVPTVRAASWRRSGGQQVVFGVGNPDADLMFVGEAPGADEDIQGIPFVGKRRAAPDEDDPGDQPRARPGLHRQRDQVPAAGQPQSRAGRDRDLRAVPVPADRRRPARGSSSRSARSPRRRCCGREDSISRLRGRVYDFRGAKLIPTFHPSFLLRSPDRKRDAWEDLKKARALLTAPVTGAE